MDGDPRNQRMSLLKKYDIPIEHLSYEYAEKCSNKKELERIIRILRSGEEGSYPDLLKVMEDRLRELAPDSRVLRVETPILTKECLKKEEWDAVENELLSWEQEMNVMDKSLDFEKSRFEVVGNKNLPEVRKVEEKNILLKTQGNSKINADNNNNNNNNSNNINNNINNNNNKSNNKRIKSGDYEAWDKFDVDKELLKLDVEEERKQELHEKMKRQAKKLEKEKKIEIAELDKENYSSMEQQVLANQAKDRGNECYKSGDLQSALKYYEVSIKLYPTVNAYNNRAITYIKLKQYNKALEDCNKVLHLEKNNVKALHRRATAYQNLQNDKENLNYDELALHDLCEIIRLEPNNKAAQADIQKLKKKLNIEDTGKKFRMPISDSSVNNINIKKFEEKNIKDNIESIDKLPLTYYGPSTSTFQCEPYSVVHHALSGSSIPGRVICKCNSNIPRQNPLCQKCGEAMCTPKPRAIKAKTETKSIDNKDKSKTKVSDAVLPVKSENNCLVKSQSEVSEKNSKQQEEKVAIAENRKESESKKELGKNDSICQIESKKPLDVTEKNLISNTVDNSKKENPSCEMVNKTTAESHIKEAKTEQTTPSKSEEIKHTEVSNNKKSDAITAENNSSPSENNLNVKKSKNKKKKSKESKESKSLRKHFESLKIEPVKVEYANKYLHPTSVEPKIKSEPSPDVHRESNLCSNTQYKDFVPNRKCYSTEYKRPDSSASTIVPPLVQKSCSPSSNKNNYDSSSEGNKENISENGRTNNVYSGANDKDSEEVKNEVVDSAYEFTKAWEQLKKLDESYAKRAEIMRKIKPADLSKVIGMKLDSDMLSCILECLLRHLVETEPKKVVELLKQLPQIPRFELVSMFLADNDKKKMKKLIQAAEDKGFKLDEDVKKSLAAL